MDCVPIGVIGYRGAYFWKNLTHYYLPNRAYVGQKPGQNTVKELFFLALYEKKKKFFTKMIKMPIKLLKKEWSEHKIKAISVLSVLENPCAVYLFGFVHEL